MTTEPLVYVAGHLVGTLERVPGEELVYRIVPRVPAELDLTALVEERAAA